MGLRWMAALEQIVDNTVIMIIISGESRIYAAKLSGNRGMMKQKQPETKQAKQHKILLVNGLKLWICSKLQTKCGGGLKHFFIFLCEFNREKRCSSSTIHRVSLFLSSLTWVGHGYCVVCTAGTHVIDDNCRGVQICNIPDFLSERAVPRGHQRHPGSVWGHRGEPDVRIARLPVLRKGRQQDQTLDFFLGRVLAVATALGFLNPDLRTDRIQVCDVDKRRVPLFFFCNSEVQAQQVNETKWQQPRRESQTAASSDDGWCHCERAAGSGLAMSSGSALQWNCRTIPLFLLD